MWGRGDHLPPKSPGYALGECGHFIKIGKILMVTLGGWVTSTMDKIFERIEYV